MNIIILLTAIIFFYIGKYSHTDLEKKIVKKTLKKKNSGIIPYKTEEEIEFEDSDEAVEEKLWDKMLGAVKWK